MVDLAYFRVFCREWEVIKEARRRVLILLAIAVSGACYGTFKIVSYTKDEQITLWRTRYEAGEKGSMPLNAKALKSRGLQIVESMSALVLKADSERREESRLHVASRTLTNIGLYPQSELLRCESLRSEAWALRRQALSILNSINPEGALAYEDKNCIDSLPKVLRELHDIALSLID